MDSRMRATSSFTPCATSTVLALDCLTMPRKIHGRPLLRAMVRSFSTPAFASPMSRRRTILTPSFLTTRSLNSAGDFNSPRVWMVISRSRFSTRPLGSSTFCCFSARSTSSTVIRCAAIFSESSQRRMAKRCSPPMMTFDTPRIVWRRFLICFSASCVSSSGEYTSLFMPIQMTASASASCLATMGSLMVSGSLPRTRETRSRTSCAAKSTSRERSNSMVMVLTSSRLWLVSVLMPSMLLISSSSRSVTSVSTTAAFAPG